VFYVRLSYLPFLFFNHFFSYGFIILRVWMRCVKEFFCFGDTNVYSSRSIQIYVYLSVCLSINRHSIYLSLCPSICLSIYQSISMPIFITVYLSAHLSIYLSISIYLSLCLCFSLSIYLSTFLSVYQSVLLAIYPSI